MPSIKDLVMSVRPGCTVEMRAKGSKTVDARLTFDHRTMPKRLVIEPSANDFWRMKFLSDVFELLIEIDRKASLRHETPDSRLDAEVFAVLNKGERVAHLKLFSIAVIEPTHKTVDDVMLAVAEKLSEHGGDLKWAIQETRSILRDEKMITITSPQDFIFWKDDSKPRPTDSWDLHIVPGYHPCMERADKRTIMINGCTAYAIQETGLRHIYPPQGSQSRESDPSGSWNHMKNPFKAYGKEFAFTIDADTVRTAEGASIIYDLLRSALEIDGAWVSVNGGFRAPLPSGHNRIIDLSIPSPYPRAKPGTLARGSEEHCVWAYRHLKKEGKLHDAHVPEWFIKEGWLGIYKGVAYKPGSF